MKNTRRKARAQGESIAEERVNILFYLAERSALSGDLESASRYVGRARDIALKYNIRLGQRYAGNFCRGCGKYLLPGKTSIVRINSKEKRVETKCLSCHEKRYRPYINEVKERRRSRAPASNGQKA
jgi:ribonuclease P protein subunit RPR2